MDVKTIKGCSEKMNWIINLLLNAILITTVFTAGILIQYYYKIIKKDIHSK